MDQCAIVKPAGGDLCHDQELTVLMKSSSVVSLNAESIKLKKKLSRLPFAFLAEHHMELEAKNMTAFTDDTYTQQLEEETSDAAMGNLARKAAVR